MLSLTLGTWLAVCSADMTSSHMAVSRGAHERLLTSNPWVNDAIIGGTAAVGAVSLHRMGQTHPRLAVLVGVGLVGLRAGIVWHNIGVARDLARSR